MKQRRTNRNGKPRACSSWDSDEGRWRAVMNHVAEADGAFVYAVKTTGIYCRPTCPARRPKRENVRFFNSPREAERAGFRACLRCQPNRPLRDEQHRTAILAACREIETADQPPLLAALAAQAGMSPAHFHRIFKTVTGVTPKAYATARRSQRLHQSLEQGKSIASAALAAGFRSNGRLYAHSAKSLGMTPAAFRRGGEGTTLRFAVGQCSLGAILVAASPRGICSIALGEDPAALVRELQDRFPRAKLIGGDRQFERWMARVVGFVERPAAGLDLPLDVQGTAFQQQVWQALCQVPCGQTTTYAQIARRIGRPTAMRAVGSAIAANPLAVAIPCHRVIRTDGSLSGYRWGVKRKANLIERERR